MMLGTDIPAATVDFSDLLARVEGDRELLCELFALFKEDFPPLLSEIEQSLARNDLAAMVRPAHTLGGMLANLSMTAAHAASAAIERGCAERSPARVLEGLRLLREELPPTLAEVDRYLCGAPR